MMKVRNHRLIQANDQAFSYEASPNRGGVLNPQYVVMHYTSSPSLASSVTWFKNPAAKASAHLVIDRDGSIVQMVPFNRIAWHAGESAWQNLTGLNQHAIGIELVNAGKLTRAGTDGAGQPQWRAWFGNTYGNDRVLEATHRNETLPAGWEIFPHAQIEAALTAASVLTQKYNLKDVLGHDDIAPFRKVDPGPAFPMGSFRSRVMGRDENQFAIFETTVHLNIRTGAGTGFAKLDASPLPPQTRVIILDMDHQWRFVDVLDPINGDVDVQGWVHGRYLQEV